MDVANFVEHIEKIKGMTPREVIKQIRWDEASNKGSIYDAIKLVTGNANERDVFGRLKITNPEVVAKVDNIKFPGKGQKETPCADAVTLVEIAYLCPGKAAAKFRRQGAELLCRALAGDLSLVDEIIEKHAEVDQETQEKLLSGTSSTLEQANAVPKAFKYITESHPLLMQPAYYHTCHVGEDGTGKRYLKVGESNNVHARCLETDQKNKTHYHHVIPMPNVQIKMRTEKTVKMMASKLDLLGYQNEYLDPIKIGRCFGAPDYESWDTIKASLAILSVLKSVLPSDLPVLEVYYGSDNLGLGMVPESEVPWETSVRPGHELAKRSKVYVPMDNNAYHTEFELFAGYRNITEIVKQINQKLEKEAKVPSNVELERVKLETEREKTKQIQEIEATRRMESKKDFTSKLIVAGKSMDEIKELIGLIYSETPPQETDDISLLQSTTTPECISLASKLSDNCGSGSSIPPHQRVHFCELDTMNEICEKARDALLVKSTSGGIRITVYLPAVERWIKEKYPHLLRLDRTELINAIDYSLAGQLLTETTRRYYTGGCGKLGWKYYRFIDPAMQSKNDEEKAVQFATSSELQVYDEGRDALLVQCEGGGVSSRLYTAKLIDWIKVRYPTFEVPKDQFVLVRMIDQSLTGKILDTGTRIYEKTKRLHGWVNYRFKDPNTQAENDKTSATSDD